MTEKLYYKDGYLKSIDATVTDVLDDGIILDRTIFYPEGGGQPGDRGSFGPYEIENTVKGDNGEILHKINGEKPSPGDTYTLTLDWSHRYEYMTEHSAQHLVSSLLYSELGIGTLAVHQGDGFFTIETDVAEISEEKLLEIEDKASLAIREGHDIFQKCLPRSEAEDLHMRRTIKVDDDDVLVVFIDGLDKVACGGVHLKNTSEIKEIAYKGFEIIRGHVRTIWLSGDAAIRYRRENSCMLAKLSSMLSSERGNIISNTEMLIKEKITLQHEVKSLQAKIATLEYSVAMTGEVSPVMIASSSPSSSFESVIPESEKRVIMVADESSRFLFHGDKNYFDILKASIPSIKGGGRGMMYRGSFSGDRKEFLDECEKVLNG